MYKLPDTVKPSDDISIIVQMKTDALLDAYDASGSKLSFTEYSLTDEAQKVRENIAKDADTLKGKLKGIEYTVGESYNVVMSGFEITTKAANFEDICQAMKGKATVIVGEAYKPEETKLVENKVNVYNTGIFSSEEFKNTYGIDGTGMVVAVLDTGIDYYHSAFADSKFLADRNNYPIYFHCWGGADRTGSLAFLLGAFLGMTKEELIYEYEFTSLSCWGTRSRNHPPFVEFIEAFEALAGNDYKQKATFFLLEHLKLSQKQLQRIEEILIETL
jgi:hypothetical protein